jgi:hypothetical protein
LVLPLTRREIDVSDSKQLPADVVISTTVFHSVEERETELVKVARRDRDQFDCATWLHKATGLPKEEFKREVERHLTAQETQPWESIYFKVYKSQLPVIERALDTATLMLGNDKSRGYCLEMICADFLTGATLESGDGNAQESP